MQTLEMLRAKGLPEMCFAELPENGAPIMIRLGSSGYFPANLPAGTTVDEMNAKLGVTNEQVEAMLIGSMFGWDVPAADPKAHE